MMSVRTTTILPPPSCPDLLEESEDEIYLAELTPIENMAVFESDVDDAPTIPAPPPDGFLNL
jgi:hypothetical protein